MVVQDDTFPEMRPDTPDVMFQRVPVCSRLSQVQQVQSAFKESVHDMLFVRQGVGRGYDYDHVYVVCKVCKVHKVYKVLHVLTTPY